jgi:hypothetical protein
MNGKGEQGGGEQESVFKPSLPETSFSVQNAPKTLAGGLRPDPLGSLSASSGSLAAVGLREGNTLLSQL